MKSKDQKIPSDLKIKTTALVFETKTKEGKRRLLIYTAIQDFLDSYSGPLSKTTQESLQEHLVNYFSSDRFERKCSERMEKLYE